VAGVQSGPTALARERIMGGFTRAIVMTTLGIGFIAIAIIDDDSHWFIPALIVFSLGIGYLIATFVSWRMSRTLGANDELPPALRNEQPNA
jgi:hypothetical protein